MISASTSRMVTNPNTASMRFLLNNVCKGGQRSEHLLLVQSVELLFGHAQNSWGAGVRTEGLVSISLMAQPFTVTLPRVG